MALKEVAKIRVYQRGGGKYEARRWPVGSMGATESGEGDSEVEAIMALVTELEIGKSRKTQKQNRAGKKGAGHGTQSGS